jgi:hypothetical protein
MSRELSIPNPILAPGPTTPVSLDPPPGARILSATFADNCNTTRSQRFTVIPPNHLTDLIIEYNSVEDMARHRIQARILEALQNQYAYWDNNETAKPTINRYDIYQQRTLRFGRQNDLQVDEPTLRY